MNQFLQKKCCCKKKKSASSCSKISKPESLEAKLKKKLLIEIRVGAIIWRLKSFFFVGKIYAQSSNEFSCSHLLSLPHLSPLSLFLPLAHMLMFACSPTHPHTHTHTYTHSYTYTHTHSLSFWKWWDASFAVSWEIPSTYLITKAFKWLNHLFPHKK